MPSSTKRAGAEGKATTTTSRSDILGVFIAAVDNCKPAMKVLSIKKGTRVIHVPKVVLPGEQRSLAVRWIIEAANKRKESSKGVSMAQCLAEEILLAYRKEGSVREKRDAMITLAIENKQNAMGF